MTPDEQRQAERLQSFRDALEAFASDMKDRGWTELESYPTMICFAAGRVLELQGDEGGRHLAGLLNTILLSYDYAKTKPD